MNPIPNDPEARLTAFLLGELSPREAAEVRQAIDQDPNLAELHDRLRQTIGLVRAALGVPTPGLSPAETAPRLSEDRRQQLLQRFRVVPMRAKDPRRQRNWGRLAVRLAALLVLLAIVGSMLLPSLAKSKAKAYSTARLMQERETLARQRYLSESEAGETLGESVRRADQGRPASGLETIAGVKNFGRGGFGGGGGGRRGAGRPLSEQWGRDLHRSTHRGTGPIVHHRPARDGRSQDVV